MSLLIEYLADFIKDEFVKHNGPSQEELRLNLTGIPTVLRNELFEFLTSGDKGLFIEKEDVRQQVPVYLFDDNAIDPKDCPDTARCTESWWVRAVRNNESKKVCLILSDMISQGSVLSTINVIGIPHEKETLDDWKDEVLIQYLTNRIICGLFTDKKLAAKASSLLDTALAKAWKLDERYREKINSWYILKEVSESAKLDRSDSILNFAAKLGFPSVAKEESFGSKEHLSILDEIASFLRENGLNDGVQKLSSRTDDSSVHESLVLFSNHLFELGINDANEFSTDPLRYFKPYKNGESEKQKWWIKLSSECLAELLDFSEDVTQGKIIIEAVEPLLKSQAGLPHIFRDKISLAISLNDAEESNDSMEVSIYRASGNSRFQLVQENLNISSADQFLFEDDDIPSHDRFVRYKVEADGYKPSVIKLISLESYGPGLIVFSRSAKKSAPFKENKKAISRLNPNKKQTRMECGLSLKSIGKHNLEIFTSSNFDPGEIIYGYEIDSEHIEEEAKRPINQVDDNKYVCLIDTDEECEWEFFPVGKDNETKPYLVNVTADDTPQLGVSSEFERLVLANLPSTESSETTNARVEPVFSRISEYEEWVLREDDSFHPVIIGPDYIDCWKNPDWAKRPVLSKYRLNEDPRPCDQDFNVPGDFIQARKNLFKLLRESFGGTLEMASASLLKFGDLMKKSDFQISVKAYLKSYRDWIDQDFSSAFWTDTLAVYNNLPNMDVLGARPYAVLLSPFHPVRLSWQCNSQFTLQDAVEKNMNCPAASLLNPGAFPDCITLPCRSASNQLDYIDFVAMPSTSTYWSVLWSVNELELLQRSDSKTLFDADFGIEVQGLSGGFSSKQVERSIDEVWRLLSAKSSLNLGIRSKIKAQTSCNQGVETWCLNNLGSEADPWNLSAPKKLIINDQRDPELHPEQSVLSILTRSTGSAVSWFSSSSQSTKQDDLAVIAHLGLMNSKTERHGIHSAVDGNCLSRWRVRKGIDPTFIAESRIGKSTIEKNDNLLHSLLIDTVDKIESRSRETFDSFVFAPNMTELDSALKSASYAAVSSAQVDSSSFFGRNDKSYLWDYELPDYGKRSIDNAGYFLLARENEGMRKAVRVAVEMLGSSDSISDEKVSSLLDEISRRGIPTLKHLTAGGTSTLGEVGMLCALKLLQPEFQQGNRQPGLIPAWDPLTRTLNLIVPVDPFQNHFEILRNAIERKRGERPDLLLLSFNFDSDENPLNLKITAVEVKARGDKFGSSSRRDALSQASGFSAFLSKLKSRSEVSEIWAFAWRSLLATLIDYAFRVYSQLDAYDSDNWVRKHTDVLLGIASKDIQIEIDASGRLIVVDASDASSPEDLDRDGFDETIVINHKDALLLVDGNCGLLVSYIRQKIENWEMTPRAVTETVSKVAQVSEDNSEKIEEVEELTDNEVQKEKHVKVSAVAASHSEVIKEEKEPSTTNLDISNPVGIKFKVGTSVGNFTEEDFEFFPGNTELNQLNVGIVGDLGTGKTQLTKALIYNLTRDAEQNRGIAPNFLIFDYKKDYSNEDFVKATGAKVIEPFDIPLNLFDVRDREEERNPWFNASRFFIDILDKIYSGIGPVQKEKIKQAIKRAYNLPHVTAGGPTIQDVFNTYAEETAPDVPYGIMSDLVDGEYFVHDSSKVIPFSEFMSGVVVINLSSVGQDDKTKNVLVTIFLNLFYNYMLRIKKEPFVGSDPQLRFVHSMLLVDEADNIMQYEFDVLKKLLLQGREFGVGVILASQFLSHYKTSHENYLEPLLTWFVHKVPNISVKELEGIGLSSIDPSLVDKIKALKLHECLFKTLHVNGKLMRGKPFYELFNG